MKTDTQTTLGRQRRLWRRELLQIAWAMPSALSKCPSQKDQPRAPLISPQQFLKMASLRTTTIWTSPFPAPVIALRYPASKASFLKVILRLSPSPRSLQPLLALERLVFRSTLRMNYQTLLSSLHKERRMGLPLTSPCPFRPPANLWRLLPKRRS